MQLEFQFKTDGPCWDNSCPSRWRVVSAEGGYVIVGKKIDAQTRAQIGPIAEDEDLLWVPPDIIERGD